VSTGNSPLRVLKMQADGMAKLLKAISRGERVMDDRGGKIAASRASGMFRFGIAMDDKLVMVEITWKTIEATSEVALAEYILKQTKNARDTHH
jgi:hypothetical protein